jgi:hypothetical protein
VTTVLARPAAPARGAGRVDDGRPPSNRGAASTSPRDDVAKSRRGATVGGGGCGLRRDDHRNAADAARSAAGHLVAIMGEDSEAVWNSDSILAFVRQERC